MAPPRGEYPRPLLVREQWLNLNGEWQFEADPDDVGLRERWSAGRSSGARIVVPYPIESEASGVTPDDAVNVFWYQRDFTVPEDWSAPRICLHIGACDHWTRVFVNGIEVGQHRGGYSPFALDVSHALVRDGVNQLVIRVEDSPSWSQPRGKQAGTTRWPIDYDPVTGIWQTVWLEPLPEASIEQIFPVFNMAANTVDFTVGFSHNVSGSLVARISDGESVVEGRVEFEQRAEGKLSIELAAPRLWSPESPFLYDLTVCLCASDGAHLDEVLSYTGLREICVVDGGLQLNGDPLYLRGVLDQGYFPGGWYAALADADFRHDIELTLAMGFNCVRKHQKAEDPRYLYWADRLGLLVWSEMPSGRVFSTELVTTLTAEWLALVCRDRAHPCVMAWVPFNESWGVWHQSTRPPQRAFVEAMAQLTRALDGSRPVIANDGWEYSTGDMWTLHLYQSGLADRLSRLKADPQSAVTDRRNGALPGGQVDGLPILLTECGGVGFVPGDAIKDAFAYGELPATPAELEQRMRGIVAEIVNEPSVQGFVWTQLTDVQQEVNGLLYFDRTPKLDLARMKSIFGAHPLTN